MRKVAIVFVLAVIVPSLVLAWLAVRSLRDQDFVLQRQRSLLYQGVTDAMAAEAASMLVEQQHAFGSQVEDFLAQNTAASIAKTFDRQLRTNWPVAQVGFVVTVEGNILCPSPLQSAEARTFISGNGMFLANRESAEIYWSAFKQIANSPPAESASDNQVASRKDAPVQTLASRQIESDTVPAEPSNNTQVNNTSQRVYDPYQNNTVQNSSFYNTKSPSLRNVSPQQKAETWSFRNDVTANRAQTKSYPPPVSSSLQKQQSDNPSGKAHDEVFAPVVPAAQTPAPQPQPQLEFSKAIPAEAEFRQLIGEANEGTLARFVENKLNVLVWHRSPREPNYIFGAQLALPQLISQLKELAQSLESPLSDEICIAVLDENAKPVALSRADFRGNWKHPFVATEISDSLPHWEIAAYLLNPNQLTRSAKTAKLTLGLLIALLVLAIGIGSLLIVADLNRQLKLARQKTDFVSNVSHELKTPLTSIRMFSELLAEQRVHDAAKQRSYLNIITAETARLTRLINNVLDFSRMERGEKKYNFRDADLVSIVRETCESYRPHLENNSFKLECDLPPGSLPVRADTDAIAQVIVNLLSNAEKYSDSRKEIEIHVSQRDGPLPCAEVKVLDRGLGVPRGSEEKIFEKFYRAHDSLSSGIQGSGLGLTLARQIARAHGGDVAYETRAGGGSCFCLRLPMKMS